MDAFKILMFAMVLFSNKIDREQLRLMLLNLLMAKVIIHHENGLKSHLAHLTEAIIT